MSQFSLLQNTVAESPTTTSNEGGTVHVASDETVLRRFLILGSGATFYADGGDVTRSMTDSAKAFVKDNPVAALDIVWDVARNRLALKRDPTLYVHAMLTLPTVRIDVRKAAFASLLDVAPIGTDLLHWLAFRKALGGRSNRSFRKAVGDWFLNHRNLALQAVKYDQRDGWSLTDALRLARPTPETDEQGFLFQWITKPEWRDKATETPNPLINGYALLRMQDIESQAPMIIKTKRLPREAVPAPMLAHKEVWEALLPDMPSVALLRNLGKLGSLGIDVSRDKIEATSKVAHPFAILLARETYASGRGIKGSNTWPVNQRIVAALDTAFHESYKHLEVYPDLVPLIALDTSASMGAAVAGTPLSSYQAEAAIASVLAYQFPKAVFVAYSQGLTNLDPRRRSYDGFMGEIKRLEHVGTYCWLPLDLVLRAQEHVDAVVSITDSETHPYVHSRGADFYGFNAINAPYSHATKVSDLVTMIQKQRNPEFRHAVVATAANNISIANALDPRQMDFAGLSADLPVALASFLSGQA